MIPLSASWLPCDRCSWTYEACTCRGYERATAVERKRMERAVTVRHRASVALAASRVQGRRAAA